MALIAAHLNAGHSGGDSIAIGVYSPSSSTSIPPSPPFSPSLISLMVSVDVKHVYLLRIFCEFSVDVNHVYLLRIFGAILLIKLQKQISGLTLPLLFSSFFFSPFNCCFKCRFVD